MELFNEFRAKLAPAVGTAALVMAVAGVVFAPGFMADQSTGAQRVQAEDSGKTVMLAQRQ